MVSQMLVNKILSIAICLITKSEISELKVKNCCKGATHFIDGTGFTHAQQVITSYKNAPITVRAIKEFLTWVDCWK